MKLTLLYWTTYSTPGGSLQLKYIRKFMVEMELVNSPPVFFLFSFCNITFAGNISGSSSNNVDNLGVGSLLKLIETWCKLYYTLAMSLPFFSSLIEYINHLSAQILQFSYSCLCLLVF